MTQYLSEIEDYYNKNEHFLTKLPELKQHDHIDLLALNTWLNKNQRLHFMLDFFVFNVLPGILTAGLFHLFYYTCEAIINVINAFIFKEKFTFHRNWTEHLSLFKNSKTAVSEIKNIEQTIEFEISQVNITSESSNQSDTNDESELDNPSSSTTEQFIQPSTEIEKPNFLADMLPVDKYPHVFQFLALQDLTNFALTSLANHELIENYFLHFDVNQIVSLPKDSDKIEQLIQFSLNKSYKNLFIAIIRQCQEPLLSKHLHPFLIKATEENDNDSIKKILSLKDPITEQTFFDVNTPISPISEHHWITKEESILVLATKHGHPKLMQLCVDYGAEKLRSGRTQLSYAIRSKNLECVKIMLKLIPADWDMKMYLNLARLKGIVVYELTPLSEAVDFGTIEIAQYLIDQGADVNQDDDRGYPMIRALNTHNLDMCILLLQNNYDLSDHSDFFDFFVYNLKYSLPTSEIDRCKWQDKIKSSQAYKGRKDQNSDLLAFAATPEFNKAREPDHSKESCMEFYWSFLKRTENTDNSNVLLARQLLLAPLQKGPQEETQTSSLAPG